MSDQDEIVIEPDGVTTAEEYENNTDPNVMASKITVLQKQVELLTKGLDAVWEKYMDKPVDLTE